ncbi:MAG: hypothetical protein ACI4LZ_04910 [Anaerovoracaceae bacterium]
MLLGEASDILGVVTSRKKANRWKDEVLDLIEGLDKTNEFSLDGLLPQEN